MPFATATATTTAAAAAATVQRVAYPSRLMVDLMDAPASTAIHIETHEGSVRVRRAAYQTSSGYILKLEDTHDGWTYWVELDADQLIAYTVTEDTDA